MKSKEKKKKKVIFFFNKNRSENGSHADFTKTIICETHLMKERPRSKRTWD